MVYRVFDGKIKKESMISVIVPVYNVEDYLEECIESIINQTYRNLDIILVDDGSTDLSGAICDRYEKLDERIRVIHKENGGLSDARNVGLKLAKGEYVGFVDSDDFIESTMYEELLNLCKKYKVDISCCRFDFCGDAKYNELPKPTGKEEVLAAKEYLLLTLLGQSRRGRYATISVWDRLYKKECIQDYSFPKGKCYEDIVFSTNVIIHASKCAYINKNLYHYRIRVGSITAMNNRFDIRWLSDRLVEQKKQIRVLEDNSLDEVVKILKIRMYEELLFSETMEVEDVYMKQIKEEIVALNIRFSDVIFSRLPAMEKLKIFYKLYCSEKYIARKRNHE